jgi:hypothetical protein
VVLAVRTRCEPLEMCSEASTVPVRVHLHKLCIATIQERQEAHGAGSNAPDYTSPESARAANAAACQETRLHYCTVRLPDGTEIASLPLRSEPALVPAEEVASARPRRSMHSLTADHY